MKVNELNAATDKAILETRAALQLVYDTLNKGQQNKLLKEEAVKQLFDRYGVNY